MRVCYVNTLTLELVLILIIVFDVWVKLDWRSDVSSGMERVLTECVWRECNFIFTVLCVILQVEHVPDLLNV